MLEVRLPSDKPKQLGLLPESDAKSRAGSLMFTVPACAQPLLSVTVTVYALAVKLVMEFELFPLLHS